MQLQKVCKRGFFKLNISTLFNVWSELVNDRVRWRRAVKSNGVQFLMQNWFTEKQKARSKRLIKRIESGTESPVIIEKLFTRDISKVPVIIRLERALLSGAITVGRGENERTRKNKANKVVQASRISFVKLLYMEITPSSNPGEGGKERSKKKKGKKLLSEQEIEEQRVRDLAHLYYVRDNLF